MASQHCYHVLRSVVLHRLQVSSHSFLACAPNRISIARSFHSSWSAVVPPGICPRPCLWPSLLDVELRLPPVNHLLKLLGFRSMPLNTTSDLARLAPGAAVKCARPKQHPLLFEKLEVHMYIGLTPDEARPQLGLLGLSRFSSQLVRAAGISVRQAAEWLRCRKLRSSSGYFDAHLDIFSAVSRVRGAESILLLRDMPCLRVTLTAAGMMTLALEHVLEFQCCPCRWRLSVALYSRCFSNDGTMLYAVASQFVYLH